MRAAVVGAGGQVGRALLRAAPDDWTVSAFARDRLDLSNSAQLSAALTSVNPDVVINAAAYTAVDRAESDIERAYAINAEAVGALAEWCRDANARLVHISTDFVFDGRSSLAYEPRAIPNPLNVYGASKLAGERRIAGIENLRWNIVRTSWVYAPWGHNFVLTMLRLMKERGQVSVVNDQFGTPTSALYLAQFLWRIAAMPEIAGVLHYTDGGTTNWYDFAVAINEEAVAAGVLAQAASVKSILTPDYPTPAKRPAASVLATQSSMTVTGFSQPQWRQALREVLKELKP